MEKLALQLFINGENHVSAAALLVLAAIGKERVAGEFSLEVVDIKADPDRAEEAGIIAIPTLIRSWPLPVTRLIGALTVRSRVLAGLGLAPPGPE